MMRPTSGELRRADGLRRNANDLRSVLGDRGVRFRIAHAKAAKVGKDTYWIFDFEFFPAVAGPADAGILNWGRGRFTAQSCRVFW
jgi:hypothetical protein